MSCAFLDKFNLFSPPITLFYNKKKKHSRLPSFMLTILGILFFVFYAIYDFILTITRQKFTAYTYDSYVKITPEIKGDKTGFFHYYTFDNTEPNDKFITVTGYDSNYIYEYIYGKCTKDNMEGLENLIPDIEKFLNYGYCIKKSKKLSDGNITLVTDKNFVWPVIAEGGNYYYYFAVKKCSNTSNPFSKEVKECASEVEINEYLNNVRGGTVYVLNYYIDLGIFKNPICSFFYDLDMQIGSRTYTVNHINYDLAVINSHQNLSTDKITKTNTIIFSRFDTSFGEKIEGQTDHIMAMIYFWRSSKMKIYERKYDGFLTFLTEIGGIYQIITQVVSIIDICFSGYAELIDSKILFNNIKKNIKENSKIKYSVSKIGKYQSNLSNNNNYRYIIDERQINPKKRLVFSHIKRRIKSMNINKRKNTDMDDKDIGFFKYLYYLFSGCICYNKEIFKYLDIRKKILSEEFLYQLYFEKHVENFKFINADESKDDLIIPDVVNIRNLSILQKNNINSQ